MIQDVNTQELLDTLEETIQRRTSWYTPIKCDWKDVTSEHAFGHYVFFPREITSTIPLDDSRKDKAAVARKWYKCYISEKDDDVISTYEFYQAWPTLKGSIFHISCNEEFLESCVDRPDREDNLLLCVEMKKLDYIFFTSDEMLETFVERTCPLLSMRIRRWKLLNELKEHLRETRVMRK